MAWVAAGVTYGLALAAPIFSVKVCESSTSVYPENVIAGLDYLAISNFGPEVDLFAAGELLAMDDSGNFASNAGSSGSAALVSGAFAAAADYGSTQTGSSLESFVVANAVWDSVGNGNSPNAARLFSDLGTVGEAAWQAPTPTVALFCGGQFVSSTKTVALAQGANGDVYLAFETRCPGSTAMVDFYIQKRTSAGAVAWTQRFADPNGSNFNAGEAIAALAVNPATQRVAVGFTSREVRSTIFTTIGSLGGLEANLLQLSAVDGSYVSNVRVVTAATDSARAVVFSGNNAFLAVVTDGSFGKPLQGSNDLVVLRVGSTSTPSIGVTASPLPGDVQINGATMFGTTPTFVGSSTADPYGNLGVAQSSAFRVSDTSLLVVEQIWMPQSGGDSEAYSAVADGNNLYVASSRRVFPQPFAWHFIQLHKVVISTPSVLATWTTSSQSFPAMARTPESDLYVRTGTSLVKVVRDAVHFNEVQAFATSGLAVSNNSLVSISPVDLTRRRGR